MANKKEVHFFDNESEFQGGVNYKKYHNNFIKSSSSAFIYGEATPAYMFWPPAMQRIFQYNPNMKIILLLRNPITRAFSHWNMQRDRGRDKMSFREAMRLEDVRCSPYLSENYRRFSYVRRGFYSKQIERVWSFFGKEQTLIMKSEDLRGDHMNALNKICNFICVDPYAGVGEKTAHSRPYTVGIEEEDFEYLLGVYSEEIDKLENLLGWNLQSWRNGEN